MNYVSLIFDLSSFDFMDLKSNNPRRRYSGLFAPVLHEEESSPSEVMEISEETENSEENVDEPLVNVEESGNVETPEVGGAVVRRSSRRIIRAALPEPPRIPNKPMKLTANSSLKDIENYYLDKKVKRLNSSLETIFEVPQVVDNNEVVMSSRKFKRTINFNTVVAKNSTKVKKRKTKAKNVRGKKKEKKIPLEYVMQKIDEIEEP